MNLLYRFVVFVSCGVLMSGAQLDMSDMPRSICGWPSLHTGGRFPEWNTRLAQYLLAFALNDTDYVIDGVFTDQTTQDIESFQSLAGLEVDGYLNIDTWPSLTATVTPLTIGSTGLPVMALQDTLTANGFPVAISGDFDAATQTALAQFQSDRGASLTSGEEVDAQTWHLLTTMCNVTIPGHYWVDIGWPQGSVSQETYECLGDAGFEYAVVECWREKDGGTFWEECVSNIANAWAAGWSAVDVYMYPERFADPTSQVNQLLGNLTTFNVKYKNVMIDVEGDDWFSFTADENKDFMRALRNAFDTAGVPLTMYAGPQWVDYFGDGFNDFSDVPLIYAHYDNVPSFYDFYAPYGGWEAPAGKQFWDGVDGEVICGLSVDWDWSSSPFWF